MRDNQKSKVYAAEQSMRDDSPYLFRSMDKMQAFVDKVTASDFWRARTDKQYVEVVLGRRDSGKARAYIDGGKWHSQVKKHPFITLPPNWANNRMVVIHELAHILGDHYDHGEGFCADYIELVRRFESNTKARKLTEAFAEAGVKVGEITEGVA